MPDENITPTGAVIQEGSQQSQNAEKRYSGDDVSRIVKERLARETAKIQKQVDAAREDAVTMWREENGLDDEAIASLANGDKTKSELRTLALENKKLAKGFETASAELEKVRSILADERVTGKILREVSGKTVDPTLMVSILKPRAKLNPDTLEVDLYDEQGNVDPGLDFATLIEKELQSRPFLQAPIGGSGSGTRTQGGASTGQSGPDLKTAEGRIEKMKKDLAGIL